jgi:hypothetical protein
MLTINDVDWGSLPERLVNGKPIIFCIDEVRVSVKITSHLPTDNGWNVTLTVCSIPVNQAIGKKLDLSSNSVLRGMLMREEMKVRERNYGWLALAA